MVDDNFGKVFDHKLENAELLFFILEEELKIHDRELYEYFLTIELNLDSFLASQYFTLFTTSLKKE